MSDLRTWTTAGTGETRATVETDAFGLVARDLFWTWEARYDDYDRACRAVSDRVDLYPSDADAGAALRPFSRTSPPTIREEYRGEHAEAGAPVLSASADALDALLVRLRGERGRGDDVKMLEACRAVVARWTGIPSARADGQLFLTF